MSSTASPRILSAPRADHALGHGLALILRHRCPCRRRDLDQDMFSFATPRGNGALSGFPAAIRSCGDSMAWSIALRSRWVSGSESCSITGPGRVRFIACVVNTTCCRSGLPIAHQAWELVENILHRAPCVPHHVACIRSDLIEVSYRASRLVTVSSAWIALLQLRSQRLASGFGPSTSSLTRLISVSTMPTEMRMLLSCCRRSPARRSPTWRTVPRQLPAQADPVAVSGLGTAAKPAATTGAAAGSSLAATVAGVVSGAASNRLQRDPVDGHALNIRDAQQ